MNIRETIEYALEKEVMSKRMYSHVAGKTDNDEARMMLEQLAGYEATHIEIFTRALRTEIEKIGFDTESFIDSCETKPFRMMADFDQAALENSSLEEVIRIARTFEKQMSEFYGNLAAETGDETVRAMSERLSGEEMSHFEYVKRVEGVLGLSLDTDEEEFHPQ